MATSAKQKVRIHDQTGTERIKSKITIYQEAIYSRQLDGLILINFFTFFVVSFVAGLLFLYSTVSLWSFQVCDDVDLYNAITISPSQKQNIVSVTSYNASGPLSLHT